MKRYTNRHFTLLTYYRYAFQATRSSGLLTREARVADLEVRLEVLEVRLEILRARLRLGEQRVRDGDLARLASGAARVRQLGDVRRTADVSVVDLGTAAELHPAVERMRDEYDVTGRVARRVERLRLAVSLVVVLMLMTLTCVTSDVIALICSTQQYKGQIQLRYLVADRSEAGRRPAAS